MKKKENLDIEKVIHVECGAVLRYRPSTIQPGQTIKCPRCHAELKPTIRVNAVNPAINPNRIEFTTPVETNQSR